MSLAVDTGQSDWLIEIVTSQLQESVLFVYIYHIIQSYIDGFKDKVPNYLSYYICVCIWSLLLLTLIYLITETCA